MTVHRTSVAVVGLGAMGAAALHQLARRGVDCIGLDRHAPPHVFGSSHGETRITRRAVGEGGHYAPLALASHRLWRELEAATGARLLEECGCLIMASQGIAAQHHGKSDFVGRSAESARAFGIPYELFGGDEAMRRFPQLRNAEGADAFFEPGGGFVHPERCIAAALGEASRAGARVLHIAAASVTQTKEGVRIVADGAVIEAEQAIVAAGAWTGSLMGAPFDRLLKVSRQVLHWFPVEDGSYAPGHFPAVIWMHGATEEDYFYAFPSLPGSGLLKAATEQYGVTTTADAMIREVDPSEGAALHRRSLASRLANVGPLPVRSAACLYTVTPDSGFIIDLHPEMDRITVVSACSGHGFKHSAGIGEMLARAHCDGEALPEAFALARFR
jgi:sarcosine oxidase